MSGRGLVLVKKEINKLKVEQLELSERIMAINAQLSKFDRRLSTEQAKVRGKNLPLNESVTLWLKTKGEIEGERDKLISEKNQLEQRLRRLKLQSHELHDEEYFLKMNPDNVQPENLVLCPRCLKNGKKVLLSQNQRQLTCSEGHTFSLVEDMD